MCTTSTWLHRPKCPLDALTRLHALCLRAASASRYSTPVVDRPSYRHQQLYVHLDIMPMNIITEAEAQEGPSAITCALKSLLILKGRTCQRPGDMR